MTSENRVATFIKGFDREIGGGIPFGHVVLIQGSTGTMKSSLAFYILYNNALARRRGLYVTLEQEAESLLDQMEALGLDVSKTSRSLTIFDVSKGREKLRLLNEKLATLKKKKIEGLSQEHGILDIFRSRIEELRQRHSYEILVIDSLDALELVVDFPNRRRDVFDFFEWLRSLGLTVFIISESGINLSDLLLLKEDGDEAFLADAILELKMEVVNDIDVQRRIRCVKMRSVNHRTDYFHLMHEGRQFEIAKAIR